MSGPPRAAGETNGDGPPESTDRLETDPPDGGRPELRDGPTVAALAALVVALSGVAGPAGAGCGLATVAVWYAVGTPYAVAFGHVALVWLFPTGIDPTSFAVSMAGFGALVLASAPRTEARLAIRYVAVALASAGALGGVGWVVVGPAERPIWVAAAATLAVLAGGVYGLHRYGVVFVLERDDGRDEPRVRTDESTAEPMASEPTGDGGSPTGNADPTTDGESQL